MTTRRSRWWKLALVIGVAALVAAGVFLFLRWRSPSPSVEAFCERIAEAQDLDTSFARLDVASMERQLSSLRAAAEVAPAEVATQVRTVLALTEVVAQAVSDNPSEPAASVTQVLRDRRDQLDSVARSGQEVERYAAATCGIQLGSDADVSGSRPA